jgi:hypothetical protein
VACSEDLLRAFTLALIASGHAEDDAAALEVRCFFLEALPVRQIVDGPNQTPPQPVVQACWVEATDAFVPSYHEDLVRSKSGAGHLGQRGRRFIEIRQPSDESMPWLCQQIRTWWLGKEVFGRQALTRPFVPEGPGMDPSSSYANSVTDLL